MLRKKYFIAICVVFALLVFSGIFPAYGQTNPHWKIHDLSRPNPPIITPGTFSTQDAVGKAPSDAIILFDGSDLSAWVSSSDGKEAKWNMGDGFFETVKGTGSIQTKQAFGDCQLHIEWAAPVPPKGKGQGRGNSGVYLMSKYEVQVLDCYENTTYADGQTAALYGQYPPLVNACLPPGMWQVYDIVFHAPRFCKDGKLLKPARITVFHNGVLVQDNVELKGPTDWMNKLDYSVHPDKLPIMLQDHSNPVRYRNIWIRELPNPAEFANEPKEVYLIPKQKEKYLGDYEINKNHIMKISMENDQLYIRLSKTKWPLYSSSETEFFLKDVDVQVGFDIDKDGTVTSLTFRHGDSKSEAKKI